MRYFYFLLTFIFLSFNLSAQIHKKFYDKKGRLTQDSSKAISYAIYQLTKEDSVWSTAFFDMKNYPILKGYFLDDDLTIRQGKFDFYSTIIVQKKTDEHKSSIDTESYKKTTCYYDNNLKTGNWVEYDSDKNKRISCYYENDTLNGRYEEYDKNGFAHLKGDYINGMRVGDWYSFNADSSVAYIMHYSKNGSLYDFAKINQSSTYYSAYSGFNFYRYIKKFLLHQEHQYAMVVC